MANATIVGGLIGASVGVKEIDKELVQSALTVKEDQ